jgi:Mn-containing catalase
MATGTKVADVFVDIGYDLTNYKKGLAQAQKEAQSVGGQIRAALGGGTGTYTSGFAKVIQDIRSGTPVLAAFRANLPAVGRDLAKLSVSGLNSGLNALQGVGVRVFGGLRSLAGNVFKGIALGAGITAFLGVEQIVSRLTQAIPDLITKGKDWAEAIHTITLATGASAEAASTQAAAYRFLGGDTAQYTTQVVRLAARLKQHEAQLTSLGVVLKDGEGNWLNQITIIDNMRKVFGNMPDGIDKTRLAFQLFGQRGAQMFGPLIHYIGLTDQQVNLLAADAKAQGLIVSDSTTKLGDAVDKAHNRIDNALTGLGTILFETLGPQVVTFFDGVAQAISANADKIRSVLGQIGTGVLAFVQTLLGINPALASFSTQFARIDDGGANYTATLMDLQTSLDAVDKKIKAATQSTAGSTKATDAQIAAVKALETAQDRTYKTGLAGLNAQLDAQLRLIDAGDLVLQRARQDAQNRRDLADAQQALTDAQVAAGGVKPGDVQGAHSAAEAVASAEQRIADLRQSIADEARARTEQDRKAQIQSVKDFITEIDKLVSDGGTGTLATLKAREKALRAAGPTTAGSDAGIELAAIMTAEKRVKEQTANAKQENSLLAEKTRLQGAASASTLTGLEKERAAILKKMAAVTASAKVDAAAAAAAVRDREDRRAGYGEAEAAAVRDREDRQKAIVQISGPDNSLTSGLAKAEQAGIDAANGMKEAFVGKDGKGGFFGALGSVIDELGKLAQWGSDNQGLLTILAGIVGVGTANPALVGGAFASSANAPVGNRFTPLEDFLFKQFGFVTPGWKPAPAPGGHAAGGWAGLHGPELSWLGERGPEFVIPAGQMGAMIGGQPAIIRLEIGGRTLLDYVDQNLAYRRIKRT